MSIEGTTDPRFAAVGEEFARNFAQRGEVGASVCVTLDGETVVDLWGGVADPQTGAPWVKDTISTIMSCTKGAAALCTHVLLDRGLIELDAPVATYWPEFAKNGKEGVTIRHVLTHTSGLPHVRSEIPEDGFCDWELITRALEDQTPFWPVGTRQAYHGLTFGHLAGEVVRRVTGRRIGQFFAEEVAGPLGLDFFIGAPESEHHRVAPLIQTALPDAAGNRLIAEVFNNPDSVMCVLFMNSGAWFLRYNEPMYWSAEIPSANGLTNARGLAGMYAPLANGGAAGGVRLVSPETAAGMTVVNSYTQEDGTILGRYGYTLGFHLSTDNRTNPGLEFMTCLWGREGFGHCGMGGSIGFADPRARISFGYTMNKMGESMFPDERGQSLVDAVYRTLGYTTNAPGAWV